MYSNTVVLLVAVLVGLASSWCAAQSPVADLAPATPAIDPEEYTYTADGKLCEANSAIAVIRTNAKLGSDDVDLAMAAIGAETGGEILGYYLVDSPDPSRTIAVLGTRGLLPGLPRKISTPLTRQCGLYVYIEPDYVRFPTWMPNDYYFNRQELGCEDYYSYDQWNLRVAQFPGAWDVTQGSSGTLIGILDSGCASTHPDLQGKLDLSLSSTCTCTAPPIEVCDCTRGIFTDLTGHGTKVIGVALAATNNTIGIAGACPNCTGVMYKVDNSSGGIVDKWVITAITHAIQDGVDVLNMSFAASSYSEAVHLKVQDALNAGIVVVASAGNSGTNTPQYPAACPGVLSVGGTDEVDHFINQSGFGSWLGVAAPAYANVNCIESYSTTSSGGYAEVWGTSYATALVSGLAGLVRSQFPTFSPEAVVTQITATADPITPYDDKHGSGRVNAQRALTEQRPRFAVKGPTTVMDDAPLGNGNGIPQAGETVLVIPLLRNVSGFTAPAVTVALETTSPHLSVLTAPQTLTGPINSGDERSAAFLLTLASDQPPYEELDLSLRLSITGQPDAVLPVRGLYSELRKWTRRALAGQYAPVVTDGYIAWSDSRNGDWDIYLRDLSTQSEYLVSRGDGIPDPNYQGLPAIDQTVLVFEDFQWNQTSQISLVDLMPSPTMPIRITPGGVDWTRYEAPDIISDLVTFAGCAADYPYANCVDGGPYLWTYNISTGVATQLFTSGGPVDHPRAWVTAGHAGLVWWDYRDGAQIFGCNLNADYTACDPPTGAAIVPGYSISSEQIGVRADGGWLVWRDGTYRVLKWDRFSGTVSVVATGEPPAGGWGGGADCARRRIAYSKCLTCGAPFSDKCYDVYVVNEAFFDYATTEFRLTASLPKTTSMAAGAGVVDLDGDQLVFTDYAYDDADVTYVQFAENPRAEFIQPAGCDVISNVCLPYEVVFQIVGSDPIQGVELQFVRDGVAQLVVAPTYSPATQTWRYVLGAGALAPGPYTIVPVIVAAYGPRIQDPCQGLVVCLLGDFDCDGSVDLDDISPFVQALIDPAGYQTNHPGCDILHADMNGSGTVDGQDIQGFVNALLGG